MLWTHRTTVKPLTPTRQSDQQQGRRNEDPYAK
jgi:hypothetical protein